MPFGLWILAGVILLLLFLWRLMTPSMDGIVDEAARTKDVGPLVDAIGRKREEARPTAFNHAIRRLWDTYERALATVLIRELATRHNSANIAQYWIKQALAAEPAIAKKTFSQSFLKTHYQPEVAARCGPVG